MIDVKPETMQAAFEASEKELRERIQSATDQDSFKQVMYFMQIKSAHTLAVLIFNSQLKTGKPLMDLYNMVTQNIREELKMLAEQYENGETETFRHRVGGNSEGTDGTSEDDSGEGSRG